MSFKKLQLFSLHVSQRSIQSAYDGCSAGSTLLRDLHEGVIPLADWLQACVISITMRLHDGLKNLEHGDEMKVDSTESKHFDQPASLLKICWL
jgi:hypothetical protein